ncbi:MAG: histidine kinase [Beijerinckiaceae bacterium]
MPTIFRFLMICSILFGAGYAVIFGLATLLEPAPRETTIVVPPSRYAK